MIKSKKFKRYSETLQCPLDEDLRKDKKGSFIYSPKTVFIIHSVQFLPNMINDGNAKLVEDENYVEMPFYDDSTWMIVKTTLTRRLLCCQDFEDAVISYNAKFKDLWKRLDNN